MVSLVLNDLSSVLQLTFAVACLSIGQLFVQLFLQFKKSMVLLERTCPHLLMLSLLFELFLEKKEKSNWFDYHFSLVQSILDYRSALCKSCG